MNNKNLGRSLRKEYRYRSCYIGSSPKKLKALAKQLTNLNIEQAINLAMFSTRGFSKALVKCFKSIQSNLTNVRLVPEADVKGLIFEKIVVEKKFFTRGHRIRARGHASTSLKNFCTLNLHLRNSNQCHTPN